MKGGIALNASSMQPLPGGYYVENIGTDAANRRATFAIAR